MYRWAKTVWSTIQPHERQALLRSRRSTRQSGFFDGLIQGNLPGYQKYPPVKCSMEEERLFSRWKREVSPIMFQDHSKIENYTQKEKWYGLEIPKQWNGIEGSPYFHSRVLRWLATLDKQANWIHRIMVPNSLGPAQLLLKFGTTLQKRTILPFLADGSKIPCFGLTGPWNGSDASAIPDKGVLETNGEGIPGIRFSCEKRWITLSPIADVFGIAIRVDGHGITLLLVDKTILSKEDQEKIRIRHHQPIGSSFPNGYLTIDNLWIPLESHVLGGSSQLGQGWKMLMECLGHGRGISLPSVTSGANASIVWHTLWYSIVRKQFQTPLCDIEGPRRMLNEIIMLWYMTYVLQEFYHATLVQQEESSAFSGVMKYICTTFHRELVLRSMDIFAGKGISLGPQNPIASYYQQLPIPITVEGSNTLTKNVIIPIQSLFEHHPFLSSITSTLENESSSHSFYRVTGKGIRDGVVHCVKSLHSSSSRRVCFQYYCMLYGQRLRKRQDLSETLSDWIMYDVMTYVLQWSSHHFPFIPKDFHQACQDYQRRIFFERSFHSQPSSLFSSPSRCWTSHLLQNPSWYECLTKDLTSPSPSSPFEQVEQKWWKSMGHDHHKNKNTIQNQNLSLSAFSQQLCPVLQRQIIDVDSFSSPNKSLPT